MSSENIEFWLYVIVFFLTVISASVFSDLEGFDGVTRWFGFIVITAIGGIIGMIVLALIYLSHNAGVLP